MDLFKLIVILFLSVYNLYLYVSSNLDNYISSRFFSFSLIASVIGIAISLAGIIYILVKQKDKKELLDFVTPVLTLFFVIMAGIIVNPVFLLISIPLFIYFKKDIKLKLDLGILLVVVIVLGFGIPSTSLTSITASQRSGDLNSVTLENRLNTLSRFADSANYDIGDWIASINYNPDLTKYDGKSVDVTGFIFAPNYYPSDTFLAARFVVTCCAVDARPVGLNVKLEGWQNQFKSDEWVNIKGKFTLGKINEVGQLVIIPDSIELTKEPDRPYIY